MPLRDPNYSMVPETTVRAFREMRGMMQNEIGLYVPKSLMGQANGVATLDANKKVVQDPASPLPVTVRNAIQSCVVDVAGQPAFLSAGTGRAVALTGPLTVSFSSGMREYVETIQDTVANAWSNLPAAKAITAVTRSGSVATYACAGHGFPVGGEVTIVGIVPAGYNGTKRITGVPDANHFTCTVDGSLATPGTISGDEKAEPTVFLGVDRDPVTTAITFVYSLLPPNDDPTMPGTPVEDQHWFDPQGYVMWRYDGAAWVAKQRIFVGECVMDTAGIVAGSIVGYALLARFDSGRFDIAASENYTKSHNIGVIPLDEVTIFLYASDGTISKARYWDLSSATHMGVTLVGITRKSFTMRTGDDISASADHSGWGSGASNKAAIAARIIAKRGY